MDKNKPSFAFTLIEVIVSFGIILLFSGVFLANFYFYSESKKLKTEAQKLKTTVELARKMATSAEGNYCNGSPFGFQVNVSSSFFQLKACCNQNCQNSPLISQFDFPRNIILNGDSLTVTFKTPNGWLYQSNPNNSIDIIIKNSVLNRCIKFSINYYGTISEENEYGC